MFIYIYIGHEPLSTFLMNRAYSFLNCNAHCGCFGVKFVWVCNLKWSLLWSVVRHCGFDAATSGLCCGQFLWLGVCAIVVWCSCGGDRNRNIAAASRDAICNLQQAEPEICLSSFASTPSDDVYAWYGCNLWFTTVIWSLMVKFIWWS